jgi:RNA 3'-terminal phosphate cyclase (ATP)
MITIDGSQGEGGGQVLRTALGLSVVTGRGFRIEKIRANRPKPGLRRQHLMCVQAAGQIGAADVQGDEVRSTEVTFVPRANLAGKYHFDIGTAGSTTLVLQTILPPLMVAGGPSTVILKGGTHNPMAPPYDFLSEAFRPVIERAGPRVTLHLERPGFFPNGGGELRVDIEPVPVLNPVEIVEKGKLLDRVGRIYLAGLPLHIAEREQLAVQKALGWDPKLFDMRFFDNHCGPGNVVCLVLRHENVTEVFTGFGRQGLPAERVARSAARDLKNYKNGVAPVGEHLADQLLIPLAMAGRGRFQTVKPTLHTMTNIEIIKMFLDVNFEVNQLSASQFEIAIR